MSVKKSKTTKVDPKFEKLGRDTMYYRASKGLANKKPRDTSIRKFTELLQNTQGWRMSLEELKFKKKLRRL